MPVKFTSHRKEFDRKGDSIIDMLMGMMSIDIERTMKMSSGMPVDKGQMKAATRSFKTQKGKYRVEINKEYAAAQEKGEMTVKSDRVVTPDDGQTFFTLKAGTYRFRNYTTAGTGAGFFRRAIDSVWRNRANYVSIVRKANNI